LLGDQGRVIQILTNLLSNAHKYTPVGGSIAIAARREGGEVCVEIRDSGVGLTVEEQSQLFAKFFRASNRATQEVGGTGLGLAITRSLVEMHGGQITVQSVPGEGSTFSFTLPIVPAPPEWGSANGLAVGEDA
jgi:signal transduction histidine kinase